MDELELTDERWDRIAGLLPPQKPKTGRPNTDHRLILSGILWVIRTGCSWRAFAAGDPGQHGDHVEAGGYMAGGEGIPVAGAADQPAVQARLPDDHSTTGGVTGNLALRTDLPATIDISPRVDRMLEEVCSWPAPPWSTRSPWP